MIDNVTFTETYANKVDDSQGIYVVPAFTGLRAPYWDQYTRGVIVGLTGGVEKKLYWGNIRVDCLSKS